MALIETKINKDRENEQSLNFGFSGNFCVKTEGRAGGIWLFWWKKVVKVEVILKHNQYLHIKITERNGKC